MTVLLGKVDTKRKAQSLIAEKQKALAKVRAKLKKDNTMHVRAALKGEENELVQDIKKIKKHEDGLRK